MTRYSRRNWWNTSFNVRCIPRGIMLTQGWQKLFFLVYFKIYCLYFSAINYQWKCQIKYMYTCINSTTLGVRGRLFYPFNINLFLVTYTFLYKITIEKLNLKFVNYFFFFFSCSWWTLQLSEIPSLTAILIDHLFKVKFHRFCNILTSCKDGVIFFLRLRTAVLL